MPQRTKDSLDPLSIHNRAMDTMVYLIAVVAVLCLQAGLVRPDTAIEEDWYAWKGRHEKAYSGEAEEGEKRGVWEKNYWLVKEHNNAALSFSLELNEFADLVRRTVAMMLNGYSAKIVYV